MNKILSSVIVASALALTGVSASAATINVNQTGSTSGTIFYGTKGFALSANHINFEVVGLPGGNSLDCRSCQLHFTTGSQTGDDEYTFGGGGPISLSGELYDGDTQIGSGDKILSGYFVGNQSVQKNSETSLSFFGTGQMHGNQGSLFSYYDKIAGTSTADSDHGFAISILSNNSENIFNDDGTFSGDVTGSDLNITVSDPVASAVAEPSDIGLLGLGALLIVGALALRRRKMPLIG